jgi:hypothetical protein
MPGIPRPFPAASSCGGYKVVHSVLVYRIDARKASTVA